MKSSPSAAEAQAALSRGDLQGAVRLSRIAVQQDPDDAEAHNTLGTALAKAGDRAGAEAAYRAAARAAPKLYKPYANLANLLAGAGRIEEARQQLHVAASLEPSAGRLWLRLAQLHLLASDEGEAKRALTRALETDEALEQRPLEPPILALLARLTRDRAQHPRALQFAALLRERAPDPEADEVALLLSSCL